MLPRRHRLTHQDVAVVFNSSVRPVHGEHLSIRAMPVSEERAAGVAVVVPKRIAKRAVPRTRLRRRIAAAVARVLPQGPAGHSVVVLAKSTAAEVSTHTLARELTALFSRAGVR